MTGDRGDPLPAESGDVTEQSAEDWEERILRFRHLTGVWALLYSAAAAFLTISHLWTWGFSPQPFIKFLPLHLGVVFLIVFFLFPTTRRWSVREPGEEPWKKHANVAVAAFDVALALVATYTTVYLYLYSDEIIARTGALSSWDIVVGTIGVLLVAEATRRAVGWPMVILSGLFVVYAMFGSRLQDTPLATLRTRDRDWTQVVEQLWFGTTGVFSVPVQVAATYVIIFVALGAFFKYSGVGEFFINAAYSLTGHRRGGPAKTSILASALMGTMSGSSIGNAVTTGAFTIPLMRRVGYRREFAGAVEASASAGGQIMPPILGAAAFVMVEFLAIPYRTIVIASIIPALAFFVGAWIMVHLEAKKRGLRSVPKAELPRTTDILRKEWYFLVPFALLFGLLMTNEVSIFRAGIYVILLTFAYLVLRAMKDAGVRLEGARLFLVLAPFVVMGMAILLTIMDLYPWPLKDAIVAATLAELVVLAALSVKDRRAVAAFSRLRETFDDVGRNMVGVSMACAAAGVIAGVVTLTGFGNKIVLLISRGSFSIWNGVVDALTFLPVLDTLIGPALADVAGAPFFIALILTMFACIVLGMGLPTTATYIVVVTIAAPAIVNFPGFVPPNGLDKTTWLLSAHLFVLFYGVVADVTPPVALAAYAASGIAGGDQFKTGIEAFKISANKFLVPFAFIYQPAILFIGVRWTEPWFMATMVWDIALIFVGIFFLHAGLSRFMITFATRWEGFMWAVGGAFLMFPNAVTDAIGLTLVTIATFTHVRRSRVTPSPPTAPAS